ncbi:MAG: phosphoribosylformylglycinamidine synthase subunit PurL, partial [Aeromicrobium sp.]
KTLAGIGENAGVIDVGQGYAVTFKVESHNHPSYVEPYQGAATGVGGYGNCLGLPNIGGEVVFDESYLGNPLVNALCVGVLRHEDLHLAFASGVGNKVVLYGARTGGDGIGGVSVLASETFDADGPAKRPSVQVGDPFMEKLLIECTLELFRAEVVNGIQDLGGAGLSCATSELASAGSGGMHVELDTVPLRDSTLSPEEILMSESQERMMAVVEPKHLDEFMAICEKWDVEAVVVGEVTDGDHLVIDWHGETVVDVPPRSVAHDGPTYNRPYARPSWQDALQADGAENLRRPASGDELRDQIIAVVTSPNMADKSWITDQYDRYVQGNTVLAQPEDAGVVRIDEETHLGVAVSTDCNGRFAKLDPYVGAQLALVESYRNVAVTGALPLAVTDCLNFGSPEDPDVMWQFEQATHGLKDGCEVLGIPVTGGNVSFYNQTGENPILPTPVVGVLGVINDVRQRIKQGFTGDGSHVLVLGETREELSGSAWSGVVHGHLGGTPPVVDFAAEQALAALMVEAAGTGIVESAHDLSDGGLAVALAEATFRNGVGVRVELDDPFVELFSESSARAMVVVSEDQHEQLVSLAEKHGVELASVGRTGGTDLEVVGQLSIPVAELKAAWQATIPAALA